ncbi:acetoacetate decarboxylase family protein [Actinocorallia aurantiaca]|uniref:Acetoacetate decarboxylase family protein n=1 Tax=Actinocorallia aurantiaca TaxID=46204 RepID=A0ABP6GYG0_9ACTN
MHQVLDRTVTMPVEIRHARVASAMFPVPARTAQTIIGYSGLDVVRTLPSHTICSLAFIEYVDGDLGPYHEFAVAFLVHHPRSVDSSGIGAFIHWLPVDGEFTLQAGRQIWGFPKVLTHLPIDWDGPQRCAIHQDGELVAAMSVKPGLPIPDGSAAPVIDAYSCYDGVTRRVPWTMRPSGVRMRPGGGVVTLGDHPAADDLRRLGLHRVPALSSTTVEHLGMTFGEAEEVTTA